MSQALEDGGLGGGACQPMKERGCTWVGTFRSGAKGQSTERPDAAVVRQAGALEFLNPGNRLDDLGSMSPGGGAHSPWSSSYPRGDAFWERLFTGRTFSNPPFQVLDLH